MIKFKRLFLPVLLLLLLLVGCSMGNTPTGKVEDLMHKYQTLDNDIKKSIDNVIDNNIMSEKQEKRYRNLLEKQYRNLTYDIKNEEINGDIAIVKTEIEVLDYRNTVNKLEDEYAGSSDYGSSSYIDSKLDELEKTTDKVTYTIDFTCTKDEDGKWSLDNLTNLDIQKIQGMY